MNPRFSDPAVLAHLGTLQQVIARMATNSSNCKAWSITIVSAILVVGADKASTAFALVALVPAFLFFLLDAYYLALEKGFRRSHNAYVQRVNGGKEEPTDLFAIEPVGDYWTDALTATFSFSVWPFYVLLFVAIFAVAAINNG